MTPILTNTYFSCAGLMDIGLKAGGLTLQLSFEIDRICCDTMSWNFAHEVVQSDITKKLVLADKDCHVMVATYPCTKYSPIGDIHGVRTETICSYISFGMICRDGDEPATKSAALLVLMAALEDAAHPRALANTVKHLAFTRCGELNFCDMVDAQISELESELLRE